MRREALRVAARAVEQRFNADESDRASSASCSKCGKPARYVERRTKVFVTALDEMTLKRAYFHCEDCQSGFFPRDAALGLVGTSLSPAITRMIGQVAARESFVESSELLAELAGVAVDAKQIERTAEALGREIAADEQRVVVAVEAHEIAPTMYLGMDGTGIPMRAAELVGRPGKQADGSSKTREVKLVTVWSAESHDDQGLPVRDAGSISYSAAIESAARRDVDELPSEFAARSVREAERRGFDRAQRKVVLGDGAPWIWKIAEEHFPDAIQIVDRFHAKQHLSDVAKVIYGPGSELAGHWTKLRHGELDDGDIDRILRALTPHIRAVDEARKCFDYFDKNQDRMRYADFHGQGLCTSTGVVEAGCRNAIGARCKRSGMHWTVAGANAIIALRCSKLSGRFEDFWERRAVG